MEPKNTESLFSPATTQRASEVIYDQIYQKIISGALRPGDRLPSERELAEQFHRSRPSVREALRMLQQDGLLKITVGSAGGAVVQGMSMKIAEEPLKKLVDLGAIKFHELVDYRIISDRGCARLAAQHYTEEDAANLRRIMEEYRAYTHDSERLRLIDIEFHKALAQATHNSLAILMNDVVVTLNTNMFWDAVRELPPEKIAQVNQQACESHYAIMEAVLARDPERAVHSIDRTVDLFREAVP